MDGDSKGQGWMGTARDRDGWGQLAWEAARDMDGCGQLGWIGTAGLWSSTGQGWMGTARDMDGWGQQETGMDGDSGVIESHLCCAHVHTLC